MCSAKTLGWGAGKGLEPVAPGLRPGLEKENPNLRDTQGFHLGEELPNLDGKLLRNLRSSNNPSPSPWRFLSKA